MIQALATLVIFAAMMAAYEWSERPRRRGTPLQLGYGNQRPTIDTTEGQPLPLVWGEPLRPDGTPLYQTPLIWTLRDNVSTEEG
jgi:hypothetical protein